MRQTSASAARKMRVGGFLAALLPGLVSAQAPSSLLAADTVLLIGAAEATRPTAAFALPAAAATAWTAPVADGASQAHHRMHVLAKPSAVLTRLELCLEQGSGANPARACRLTELFADTGVFSDSLPAEDWEITGGFDWSEAPARFTLTLLDGYDVAVDPGTSGWVGSPYQALYYPLRLRFSFMLTAPNAEFPGWNLDPAGIDPPTARGSGATLLRHGDGLHIRFPSPSVSPHAPASLRLFDLQGRLLARLALAPAAQGETRRIPLPPGLRSHRMLLVELSVGGETFRQTLPRP